jgi:hypothetical protein
VLGSRGGNRGDKIATGFLYAGLRSHVLLAACSAKGVAQEVVEEIQGRYVWRGVFTQALLKVLSEVDLNAVSYFGLMLLIHLCLDG